MLSLVEAFIEFFSRIYNSTILHIGNDNALGHRDQQPEGSNHIGC